LQIAELSRARLPSVLRHLACRKLDAGLSVVTIWLELCTSYSFSYHHPPPPSPLSTTKSRMETFCYRLTQVTCDLDTTYKVKKSKINLQGAGHIVMASSTACLNSGLAILSQPRVQKVSIFNNLRSP